jgi:hypothetical protein
VGGVVAGVLGALETEAHGIDAGQEVLVAAEEHGAIARCSSSINPAVRYW